MSVDYGQVIHEEILSISEQINRAGRAGQLVKIEEMLLDIVQYLEDVDHEFSAMVCKSPSMNTTLPNFDVTWSDGDDKGTVVLHMDNFLSSFDDDDANDVDNFNRAMGIL